MLILRRFQLVFLFVKCLFTLYKFSLLKIDLFTQVFFFKFIITSLLLPIQMIDL